ncbi:MAG: LysE family translocator [Candidatus Pelagibacter sp. TMED253]|nr:MAG: LysE family translocator [Candidatus Pelagibacter sp. TMED253]|tara:strand:+ start:1003 stop:1590 length:588 start_codon:yes stop_codon:yes gene_type:complete
MFSQFFPFLLFSFVAAFTPGPNNIMTSYTAFNFGIKKAIPTMLGVIFGWTTLIIILQLGSVIIFQKFEYLQIIIKVLGSIYLLFMAYKLAVPGKKNNKTSPKPVTFLNTYFFQFVNPKSIVVGLTAISIFIDVNNFLMDSLILTIVFFFMAIGSQTAWCVLGKYMRKFATSNRFIQNFNYTMSFLLIVCVILFYV